MASRTRTVNKASAIFLSLLVPTLLLCAFVLSVVGTAGKSWSWRVEKSLAEVYLECMGINHRGPFQYCNLALRANAPNITTMTTTTEEATEPTPTAHDATTADGAASETSTPTVTACPNAVAGSRWEQICVRATNPGGACSVKPNQYTTFLGRETNGSSRFCQQLRISGSLLIAGCALIGIGMLASFVLAGISLLQLFGRYKAPDDTSSPSIGAVSLFTSVVTGLGFLAMLIGTVIAADNLVNLQFPSGDWYTSSGDVANSGAYSPWLLGSSVGIATAGWVLAGVAASLVTKVWPGPTAYYQRVGTSETADRRARSGAKDDHTA